MSDTKKESTEDNERPTFAYLSIDVPEVLHKQLSRDNKIHVSRKGYVCISLKRPLKGSDSDEYTAGLSFCSPLDITDAQDRLNKKKSRMIAEGRRKCNRSGRRVEIKYPRGENFSIRDVHKAVLDKVLSDSFVVEKRGDSVSYAPRWAKEAIKLGGNFEFADNRR